MPEKNTKDIYDKLFEAAGLDYKPEDRAIATEAEDKAKIDKFPIIMAIYSAKLQAKHDERLLMFTLVLIIVTAVSMNQ